MVESANDTPGSLPDYELLPNPSGPDTPPGGGSGLWIALAVALLVLAGVAYYVIAGRRQAPASASATKPPTAAAPATPTRPLGAVAEPISVPPLDQTDPLVRELVRQLSTHPRVLAWLATKDLIRNFVVVVSNVADGRTPAPQLAVLRPSSGFRVAAAGGGMTIDPRSYQRYDALADAAASIDAAAAARVYATLKPRIEEAYEELGVSMPFDRTLERAIASLLDTPVVDDPVRIEPAGGTGYRFARPDLESRSAAQKQLLRTGARNVRTIQSALRQIALALGIPADRLPTSTQ